MKILVTGCAGFIGSNFVRWALKENKNLEVVNLDLLTYAGNLENLKDVQQDPRYKFVRGDICDLDLVRSLVGDVGAVVNFAAESHVDRSIHGSQEFVRTNINGTQNLLEAVREQNRSIRFLQISTDEVYGSLGDEGFFEEETPIAPNNPYAATKASSDLLVRSYNKTYGMDTVTTRCCNNYGPNQFPEKFIPLMVCKALKGENIPVYGDGLNIRDWIHVDDHSRGVWLALTKGKAGEVYNFGAANEWKNIDLVHEVLSILNKPKSLIEFVKDRPGHDRRYAVDARKAKIDLGWKPQIGFGEGLKTTVNWYAQNAAWITNVTSGEYLKFYQDWYGERLNSCFEEKV